MNIFHFLLDCYFTAVLGIAGIAKFDAPLSFKKTIIEYKFPRWSIPIIKNTFPWLEIFLAVFLQITRGASKSLFSIINSLLFLLFLFINIYSFNKHKSDSDCGCYGKAVQYEVSGTKVFSSGCQFLLSLGLVALSIRTKPLPKLFYFGSSSIFIVGYLWLLGRTWQRKGVYSRINRGSFHKEG